MEISSKQKYITKNPRHKYFYETLLKCLLKWNYPIHLNVREIKIRQVFYNVQQK